MKEQNPLNDLLGQIGDLLHQIQTNKVIDQIPKEALLELNRLEQAVDMFIELNQKTFQEANIDIEALKKYAKDHPSILTRDKQILDRAKDIEKEAQNLRLSLSPALSRGRKSIIKDPEKQKMKERRKKFKPLGGDRGWIPL
jgi:hypothetical protein